MSEYNFEEYKAVGGRFNPTISLSKTGGFGISAGFMRTYDYKDIVGVKLFYDKEKKAVGFKIFQKNEEGMLKAITRKDEKGVYGAYLSAKAFLLKYEIDVEKYAGRYSPKKVENGNETIFVIELEKNLP